MLGQDWFGYPVRDNYLAREFSLNLRVIYFCQKSRFSYGRSTISVREGKNLYIYWLPQEIPLNNYLDFIHRLNISRSSSFITERLKELNSTKRILYLTHPKWLDLIKEIDSELVIFDFYENFSASKKLLAGIIEYSDIIFASTDSLLRRARHINPYVYLVPNGVEEKLIDKFQTDLPSPVKLKQLGHPRLGYIGPIADYLDTALLAGMAKLHQDWVTVLIGPLQSKIGSLENIPNIYFLNEKENIDLVNYLKNLDILILPYILNDFTEHMDPILAYECLLTDKPVITTNLPQLQKFKDVFKIAESRTEFIHSLELSLSGKLTFSYEGRLLLAKENTWRSRVERETEIIQTYLEARYKR